MLAHLRNRQLIATYAVGFGVLFNFITTFTYVSFYLAAPPSAFRPVGSARSLSSTLLASLLTPWTGWAVARFGRRRFTVRVIAVWVIGIALTLVPSLPLIIAGLAICAGCGLICQAVSTAYVTVTGQSRPLVGSRALCHLAFMSAAVSAQRWAALAWNYGGWPACVALRCRHVGDNVDDRDFRLDASRARFNRGSGGRTAMTL